VIKETWHSTCIPGKKKQPRLSCFHVHLCWPASVSFFMDTNVKRPLTHTQPLKSHGSKNKTKLGNAKTEARFTTRTIQRRSRKFINKNPPRLDKKPTLFENQTLSKVGYIDVTRNYVNYLSKINDNWIKKYLDGKATLLLYKYVFRVISHLNVNRYVLEFKLHCKTDCIIKNCKSRSIKDASITTGSKHLS